MSDAGFQVAAKVTLPTWIHGRTTAVADSLDPWTVEADIRSHLGGDSSCSSRFSQIGRLLAKSVERSG